MAGSDDDDNDEQMNRSYSPNQCPVLQMVPLPAFAGQDGLNHHCKNELWTNSDEPPELVRQVPWIKQEISQPLNNNTMFVECTEVPARDLTHAMDEHCLERPENPTQVCNSNICTMPGQKCRHQQKIECYSHKQKPKERSASVREVKKVSDFDLISMFIENNKLPCEGKSQLSVKKPVVFLKHTEVINRNPGSGISRSEVNMPSDTLSCLVKDKDSPSYLPHHKQRSKHPESTVPHQSSVCSEFIIKKEPTENNSVIAPCCLHNTTTSDTISRGGSVNENTVTFSPICRNASVQNKPQRDAVCLFLNKFRRVSSVLYHQTATNATVKRASCAVTGQATAKRQTGDSKGLAVNISTGNTLHGYSCESVGQEICDASIGQSTPATETSDKSMRAGAHVSVGLSLNDKPGEMTGSVIEYTSTEKVVHQQQDVHRCHTLADTILRFENLRTGKPIGGSVGLTDKRGCEKTDSEVAVGSKSTSQSNEKLTSIAGLNGAGVESATTNESTDDVREPALRGEVHTNENSNRTAIIGHQHLSSQVDQSFSLRTRSQMRRKRCAQFSSDYGHDPAGGLSEDHGSGGGQDDDDDDDDDMMETCSSSDDWEELFIRKKSRRSISSRRKLKYSKTTKGHLNKHSNSDNLSRKMTVFSVSEGSVSKKHRSMSANCSLQNRSPMNKQHCGNEINSGKSKTQGRVGCLTKQNKLNNYFVVSQNKTGSDSSVVLASSVSKRPISVVRTKPAVRRLASEGINSAKSLSQLKPNVNTSHNPCKLLMENSHAASALPCLQKTACEDIGHSKTVFQCLICPYTKEHSDDVISHALNEHKQEVHLAISEKSEQTLPLYVGCRHCDFVAVNQLTLWNHFASYHDVSGLKPKYTKRLVPCSSGFFSRTKYKCTACEFEAIIRFDIEIHFVKKHCEKDLLLICSVCDVFCTQSIHNLRLHMKHHEVPSPLTSMATVIDMSGNEVIRLANRKPRAPSTK